MMEEDVKKFENIKAKIDELNEKRISCDTQIETYKEQLKDVYKTMKEEFSIESIEDLENEISSLEKQFIEGIHRLESKLAKMEAQLREVEKEESA